MVQAVGRPGPTGKVSSSHPLLDLSLKSGALAQPNSRAESPLRAHTASCNTHMGGHTDKLLRGPEAHFMFLSIQSLKGSTLVKAV